MDYGIDIGSSSVKVVALRRTMGGWKLVGVGRRQVPRSSGDPAALHAKILKGSIGGRQGRLAGVVGLTGRDINLQLVQQPKMAPADYRTLMRFELEHRGGDANELYTDYCTLRAPDSYFPNFVALVGIGKREYVDARIESVRRAGFDVRDAVPNAFALHRAYLAAYPEEDGTTMLLDVGSSNMEMALVRGGRIIFARNITSGSTLFDKAIAGVAGVSESKAEQLKVKHGNLAARPGMEGTKEGEIFPALRSGASQFSGIVQSSVSFAKTQTGDKDLTLDRVYLSGGGARLRGLPDYLKDVLKAEVEILDPFRNIDTSGLAEAAEDIRRLPSDLSIAVGLAHILAAPKSSQVVSIVPDVLRKRRDFFRKTLYLIASAVLLVVALSLLTVSATVRNRSERSALDQFRRENSEVTRRIETLDAAEKDLREVTARSEMVRSHTLAGRAVLDAVATLRKTLPRRIILRRIVYRVPLSPETAEGDKTMRVVALFHDPEGRLVRGEVLDESEETIRISGQPERYEKSAVRGLLHWTAPSLEVVVAGEIDGSISGGPKGALDRIVERLQDPSRGVSAKRSKYELMRERPGWKIFEIGLSFD